MYDLSFFVTSCALGAGLAMDALSVSVADSIRERDMTGGRKNLIAGIFGAFQFAMPVIGWFFVHKLVNLINVLTGLTPWISLVLLLYLGIKMIREGRSDEGQDGNGRLSFKELVTQAVATSIDALSVGFTISGYSSGMAVISGLMIGTVTFVLCRIALQTGHLIGGRTKIGETTVGGLILIIIGIKVFLDGVIL